MPSNLYLITDESGKIIDNFPEPDWIYYCIWYVVGSFYGDISLEQAIAIVEEWLNA